MHLTAESTSMDSSSLVAQAASRLPDREIKRGEEGPYLDLSESGQREKVKEMGRSGNGHCHPVLSISFAMTDGKHN